MNSTLIATIGVSMLLLAFFLNLFRFLKQESWFFLLLNFLGAGLSCYASYLINFLPFIILEGTWGGVAVVAISRKIFFGGSKTSVKPITGIISSKNSKS